MDFNTGKGYGLATDRFHKSRKQNSNFPYNDKDEYSLEYDDEPDEEALNSIGRKILNYKVSDFLSSKSANQFYFVAGNTKLSDCFYRIDKVLLEVEALGYSMSPIPSSGTKRMGSGGSSFIKSGNYKRTGTKRGYFSPPPPVVFADEHEQEETEEIYTIKDFSKILKKKSGE